MAINGDFTRCAVTDITANRVLTHVIDGAGSPPHVFDCRLNGAVFDPSYLCFAKRGSDESLLLTSGYGFAGVVEICAGGAFIRCFMVADRTPAVKYDGCVAYAPRRDVIAVAFSAADNGVDNSGIHLLSYGTGAVIRAINQVYIPSGISFSEDGAHLLCTVYGDKYVNKFGGDDLTCRTRAAIRPRVGGVLCGRHGDFVVLTHQNTTSTIFYVDGVGVHVRKKVISGDVTALAWLGDCVCYRTYEGLLRVIPKQWSTTPRGSWVAACLRPGPDGGDHPKVKRSISLRWRPWSFC